MQQPGDLLRPMLRPSTELEWFVREVGRRRGDTQRLDQNWIELDQLDQKKKKLSIWMFHEKINFKFLKMSKNRNFESKTDSTESTGSNWIKLDQKLDQTGSSFLI